MRAGSSIAIAYVEVTSAVTRMWKGNRARDHALRAYDAVHLAGALALAEGEEIGRPLGVSWVRIHPFACQECLRASKKRNGPERLALVSSRFAPANQDSISGWVPSGPKSPRRGRMRKR